MRRSNTLETKATIIATSHDLIRAQYADLKNVLQAACNQVDRAVARMEQKEKSVTINSPVPFFLVKSK